MRIPKKKLVLPQLPFSYDALEPIISEETVKTHYRGHHAGYVKTFNKLIASRNKNKSLLQFNYFGHLLHSLYWQTLAPFKSTAPYGGFLEKILEQWETIQDFINEVIDSNLQIQGSGWTLVVKSKRDGLLKLMNIPNHDLSRVLTKYAPILVIDAWEHAYYLDYKNEKKTFFENLTFLIDWDTAEKRFIS